MCTPAVIRYNKLTAKMRENAKLFQEQLYLIVLNCKIQSFHFKVFSTVVLHLEQVSSKLISQYSLCSSRKYLHSPQRRHWNFLGGGGGGGVLEKIPSEGEVWRFSGITPFSYKLEQCWASRVSLLGDFRLVIFIGPHPCGTVSYSTWFKQWRTFI